MLACQIRSAIVKLEGLRAGLLGKVLYGLGAVGEIEFATLDAGTGKYDDLGRTNSAGLARRFSPRWKV
jgi:hypothetical protein